MHQMDERIVDRLADVLFEMDAILDMLADQDAKQAESIEPVLRTICNDINELMKQLGE